MFLELLLFCSMLFSGYETNALSYDYTSIIECLENPPKPLYNGGIIKNPELDQGLEGWSTFGDAKIEHRVSSRNNNFIVAHNRKNPNDSVVYDLYLQTNNLYTFSAWLQVSDGEATIRASVETSDGYKHVGNVDAKSNCWSMIKGGVSVDQSGMARLFFSSNNTLVDFWVDSISLQPFTPQEWRSHQQESIEKTRKKNVRIKAVDKQGNPILNAKISIQQKKTKFPFGCSINNNILTNTAYQNWFAKRFKFTTFVNEMKWYSNEQTQGKVDYYTSDKMVQFAKQHGVSIRGHNVLWTDPKYIQGWINGLPWNALKQATMNRVKSVMGKYKGQVIAWDVVNENLHFSYFEDKLGKDTSAMVYNLAKNIDPKTPLFLNEYNTIEQPGDDKSTPGKYIAKINAIKAYPGNRNVKLGIGLQGHFITPNIAYMRSAIDTLATTGLPIWLTEVDVASGPNQAKHLEEILWEAYSHPKVAGVIVWWGWNPAKCDGMCLTDNNFKNTAAGDVVDKLLRRWGGFRKSVTGTTDANGIFEASLFHGEFEVRIVDHHQLSITNSSFFQPQTFSVSSTDLSEETTLVFEVSI